MVGGVRAAKAPSLVVATLICLVTSQVISYIKARAEASGLSGEGGLIERPERLIIVLVGAGLSGLFGLPWLLHVRDVGAGGGQPGHAGPAGACGADVARRDGSAAIVRSTRREREAHPPAGQGDEA